MLQLLEPPQRTASKIDAQTFFSQRHRKAIAQFLGSLGGRWSLSDLIIELLSPCTEQEDLGKTLQQVNRPPAKWEVYERILRVPYYVVYDRYENYLRAFQLIGTRYKAIALPENRLWLEELELGLGLWQGTYQQTIGLWLHWYNPAGWVPTLGEQAEQERQRAEQEYQRAERLAQYLRSQGIDPDNLS